MARTNLRVPFNEKDQAKALGAKWDATQRVWFVPDGMDAKPFAKWLDPIEEDTPTNVRADSYYIAEASRACWKCDKNTRVYAFVLEAGFEALYVEDDPKDDHWEKFPQPTFLSYIAKMPERAQQAIKSVTDKFFRDFSNMTHSNYWMNHCEHCKTLLGDFNTIEDGPFTLLNLDAARKISLRHFKEPFEGNASHCEYDSSMELFSHMRRIS